MKNLILSVLFWAVVSVSMAVKLPSSPFYSSVDTDYGNDTYTLSIGSTINNTAVLGVANYQDGACVVQQGTSADMVETDCANCCNDNVFVPCIAAGGTEESCGNLYYDCKQACKNTFSLPLGTPLLLLPFALAYAFIRKRKQA